MIMEIARGVAVPFLGTTLGAMCVFFLKKELSGRMQTALSAFAAGVMTAASIWSLLLPSVEQAASMGKWKFIPAAAGFWTGILFLELIDCFSPMDHPDKTSNHGKLLFAVTLHNIPEGMAVGVIYAGLCSRVGTITAAGAFSLALGIAIQNFPEGAIISMPLKADGMSGKKSFLMGVLSGAVEPLFAILTIWTAKLVVPVLPWMLSFAAGAMLHVVIRELIPKMNEVPEEAQEKKINEGMLLFTVGFTLMMALDVALG